MMDVPIRPAISFYILANLESLFGLTFILSSARISS
jgi:hypothetical protein